MPKPELQANLHDASGRWLARVDLYYPEARLVVEYDGSAHRGTLAADLQRQNQLVGAGYKVLRFTAADLNDPERIVALVAAQLGIRIPKRRVSTLARLASN